jgi:pectinesterase
MGAQITPAGWDNWRNPENEKTAYYAEYHCSGPGAGREGRVSWCKELSDREAKKYTVPAILGDWVKNYL